MADIFDLEVEGIPEAVASMNRLESRMDGITEDAARDQLEVIVTFLEGVVMEKTPTDTGTLRASTIGEVRTRGISLEGIVNQSQSYSLAVEIGQPKGTIVPPAQLKGWARRKLGDESAAYAVSKKIFERGTKDPKGAHMFRDAWNESLSRVTQLLEEIGVHVSRELLKTI
jgi:hypothetical protein